MNLRAKTLLVVGISLFLFIVFLFLIAYPFLFDDSVRLDESFAVKDVERIENNIISDMDMINRTNRDWAVWDDTYLFVTGKYPTYPSVNLQNDTFKNNQVNFILYIDKNQQLVYQKGYDLQKEKPIDLQSDFFRYFLPIIESPEMLNNSKIVMTDYGLSLTSFQSIYKSSGEGLTAGTLVMGKIINDTYIQSMGRKLTLPLSMNKIEGGKLPSKIDVKTVNDKEIKGSFVIKDYLETHTYEISFITDRSFYLQKKDTVKNSYKYLIITTIIFIWFILVLLNRYILSRVNRLSFQLKSIQTKRDIKSRVQIKSGYKDEITNLELSINEMLSSLEEKQNEVMKLAYYDQSTKLPNRYWLFKKFHNYLPRFGEEAAFLYFDLDGFKRVNDSLGHKIGDALIVKVAERIESIVKKHNGIIAHIGSDEFIIILKYLGEADLEKIIKNILDKVRIEYNLDPYKTYITASIGISIYPKDGQTLEQLIQKADIAMYEAKRKGKNKYRFFQKFTTQKGYRNFLELENDLKFALQNKEFELFYQMIVNGWDNRITGVEALLRWRHPTKGLIPPDKFIPIAEETGLMPSIGLWVLEEAVSQLKNWHDKGLDGLSMSINVSKTQMRDNTFIEKLDEVLKDTQISASKIHMEITETDINLYPDEITRFTMELKKREVKIALDDFGVGTSSLQYLKDLQLDIIKIDQNFIRNVPNESFDTILLYGIFEIIKRLKLEVVVEGIEKEEQINYVNSHIQSKLQGYYFSRPIPVTELEKELFNNHC